jgi:hypothetical protein
LLYGLEGDRRVRRPRLDLGQKDDAIAGFAYDALIALMAKADGRRLRGRRD